MGGEIKAAVLPNSAGYPALHSQFNFSSFVRANKCNQASTGLFSLSYNLGIRTDFLNFGLMPDPAVQNWETLYTDLCLYLTNMACCQ